MLSFVGIEAQVNFRNSKSILVIGIDAQKYIDTIGFLANDTTKSIENIKPIFSRNFFFK
jgi:hypothetical protein